MPVNNIYLPENVEKHAGNAPVMPREPESSQKTEVTVL